MKTATWSDWWASKTIRLQAYATVLFTSLIPIVITLDETQLAAFGLSDKAITLIVLGIAILKNAKDTVNRADTTKPLAGRAQAQ